VSGFFAGGTWWDVSESDSDLIKCGGETLAVAGIEGALDEARKLYTAAFPRRMFDAAEDTSDALRTRYLDLIARRANREPLSHLVGFRDFYKHRFDVSADVLDPRPETEVLVSAGLDRPFQTVLDLGTGSGCILLSLLAERPAAKGVGTDISVAALSVAHQNMRKLELDHQAKFIRSDWFSDVTGWFDLIVSNPPYIALDEMPGLSPEVRLHEPRQALTDEGDGLACYRTIIAGAPRHLTPGGRILLEIGPTQAASVSALLTAQGFAEVCTIPDLDGRDRVISAVLVAD